MPVFLAGTLLAMAAQVMKALGPGGFVFDCWLIGTGILIQFTLAYYLEWLSRLHPTGAARGKQPAALPGIASGGMAGTAGSRA